MIIKPFTNQIDSINDIGNMLGARRFIILYEYKTPKNSIYSDFPDSYPMENIYCDNLYGIYLVNISTIDGVDYIVPKSFMVHTRNAYRGSCRNPLNADGSINRNAEVSFYLGSYSNRFHNKERIHELYTSFNTFDALKTDYNSEAMMIQLLKSESAIPFPNYYNIEDQARSASTSFKGADFITNYGEVPIYRLSDLIDSRTTIIVTKVDGDENNMILDSENTHLSFGSKTSTVDISRIRSTIFDIFISCFETTMGSIFSEAYYVFDLQNGLFNVPPEYLKVKYKYGVDKDMIKDSYAYLNESASELANKITYNDNSFMQTLPQRDKDSGGEVYDLFPERLYVYTSLSTCSLKLHCKSLYGYNKGKDCSMHMNICSTGDTDEISQYYYSNQSYSELEMCHNMPEF